MALSQLSQLSQPPVRCNLSYSQGTAAVKAGESVLVTAAAGGTGHFAVQLAKLAGCRVAAVVGSEAKAQALRRLGDTAPDLIINYKQQV